MRILKWLFFVGAGVALTVGYLVISARQSALWLDSDFARQSRGWTVRASASGAKSSIFDSPVGWANGLAFAHAGRIHMAHNNWDGVAKLMSRVGNAAVQLR